MTTAQEAYAEMLVTAVRAGDCVLATKRLNRKGYSRTYVTGRGMVLVHRLANELRHGPIPPGIVIMHTCDQPACFADEHLVRGTTAQNNADMAAKGRSHRIRGEASPRAKLTDAQVVELRRRRADGEGVRALAAEFGVDHSYVSRLTTGARRVEAAR